jgi:NAD(P)-dependent dehydrogenase (short-subunit alcohol dehydrogenase family)
MLQHNILITGGSRGIGRAICKKIAQNSQCNIIFTYKSNEEQAKSICEEIELETNAKVYAYKCDMSNAQEVRNFFKNYKVKHQTIHTLINNAGITGKGALFIMTKEEDWWHVLNTNVACVYNACMGALPMMVSKKEGRIINITSLSGQRGNPGQSAYAASKAAIVAFSKSLNKEMGKRGIIVNCVSPGLIDTDMTNVVTEQYANEKIARSPLGRMGHTEEVADVVDYLIFSPAYLIGQEITIDGGIGA